MAPRWMTALPFLWGALTLGAACSQGPVGTVVVGVTSDFTTGVSFDRLHVAMKIDGSLVQDANLKLTGSNPDTSFPTELTFLDAPDGARLELTLRGFGGDDPVVVRHLETRAVGNQKLLHRINLESACELKPDDPSDPIPGAPTCNETTQTCIAGSCRDAYVAPSLLEAYRDDWENTFEDICKRFDDGDPVVIVGKGQSDYLSSDDYELAQVEAGAQGGHHVWVAARVKGLHRSGSITSVAGSVPALGIEVAPMKVIFTMDPDEADYCKIYGLRYQIDTQQEIETLLGHEMLVTVTITDSDGDVGTGERWITLSDTIL